MGKASRAHHQGDGHGLCPLPILRLIATTHLLPLAAQGWGLLETVMFCQEYQGGTDPIGQNVFAIKGGAQNGGEQWVVSQPEVIDKPEVLQGF